MGKNRDIKSVVVLLVNTVVHEIVAMHTNKPESKQFLKKEAIEYRGQAKEAFDLHTWNEFDKAHIKEKAIKEINKIMVSKYLDVASKEKEVEALVDEEIHKLRV